MKKYLLSFLFLPYFLCAQHDNFNFFPHKSELIKYLKPSQNTFVLDTNKTGFSTLEYRSFSSSGQYVGVNHQQTITNYITFNLNFHKFSQEGIFNRETLKLHDVQSNLIFKNKKENYFVDLSLGYSKIRMDENGGINNYNVDDYEDPLLFNVNLLSAQNEVKNRNHSLAQNFIFTNKWSIKHKLSILSNRKVYSDLLPNSGYYESVFLDSIATYDSLSTRDYKSIFSINYGSVSLSQLLYSRKAFVHSIDSTDHDLGLGINFNLPIFNIELNTEFYQSTHYTISFLKSIRSDKSSHRFETKFNQSRIPIFTNAFLSNHFVFNNQFKLEKSQSFNYKWSFNKGYFTSQFNRFINYIYLDQTSNFKQEFSPIIQSINTLNYQNNWSNFHLVQRLQHQYSDAQHILRFPEFNSSTSLWYESDFFDQKLNSKLGIKLSYFSTHYANAYNPALGAFYIQDQFAISATPLMSAFLNLNIHNMFVALEYNNIGNFIDSKTTYFIPNYPAYPSVIRFSVLWKLSNN